MKKISEMTPGEALTEQALAVLKRRLEQARKKAVESAAATKAVFDAIEDMCIDPDEIPSRRKTQKISRRLFAVSSTTANIPYPALCGKSARPIRRPRNDTPPEIQPPEMAVRVRLPEMRQHSRGTRPAQGQRRRLLYPVYRAHGQPPPEPDTRRRKERVLRCECFTPIPEDEEEKK